MCVGSRHTVHWQLQAVLQFPRVWVECIQVQGGAGVGATITALRVSQQHPLLVSREHLLVNVLLEGFRGYSKYVNM